METIDHQSKLPSLERIFQATTTPLLSAILGIIGLLKIINKTGLGPYLQKKNKKQ
jgi:hypothetical protein